MKEERNMLSRMLSDLTKASKLGRQELLRDSVEIQIKQMVFKEKCGLGVQ
jgi:hypothetical protein